MKIFAKRGRIILSLALLAAILLAAGIFSLPILQAQSDLMEPGPGLVEVQFTYEADEHVDEVFLSGEFNNWDPRGTEMMEEVEENVFSVTIYLEPGEYEYKFVEEGENWITPEGADDYAPDGFGGENAVVQVGEEKTLPEEPAQRGDGRISPEFFQHDREDLSYFNPLDREKVTLHFATLRDEVEEVRVHLEYPGGDKADYRMRNFLSYTTSDYYREVIELSASQFNYYFEIIDGDSVYYYGKEGDESDLDDIDKFHADLSEKDVFTTPDWARDAIFYQIFPDRFAQGSEENNPRFIEQYRDKENRYKAYIPEWHQGIKEGDDPVLRDEEQLTDDDNSIHPEAGYYAYYGGDLIGVKEKIPYLEELGINVIYFNPIFEASAYHRYNTAGFEYIDESLVYKGDQEASRQFFAELVEELAERDIKVILDGVFNHVGYEHWAFQDIVENEEDSPYIDWFNVHDFPVRTLYEQQQEDLPPNYDGWWDFGHMPELDVSNPEVRDYIWDITEQWMDKGIAGWRLDVPTDVTQTDPRFWSDWREHVKSLDEDAYISGEIWDDASSYLQGDEFDAVMNYRFRDAVNSFVGQGRSSADEFHRDMMRLFLDYPDQSVYTLQNLLGSHDTTRYMTLVDGDRARFKLSKFLQFTYFGAPMIYYGDEIGMEGGDDPDNRRTMVWEEREYTAPDEGLREYIEDLIDMRRDCKILRRGEIDTLEADYDGESEMVYAFERFLDDESVLIILNAGEEHSALEIDLENLHGRRGDPKKVMSRGEIEKDLRDEGKTLQLEISELSGIVIEMD